MTYFTYINIYLGTRIESYSEELPNVRQHFEWTWSFIYLICDVWRQNCLKTCEPNCIEKGKSL